jgi:large subunit ribosomal protein L15
VGNGHGYLSKLQARRLGKGRTRIGRGVSASARPRSRPETRKARWAGNINKLHFQGGQTDTAPVAKRGFRNPLAAVVANVNVGDLDRFDAGAQVNAESLREHRLVRGRFDIIKILGTGELTKAVTVTAHRFSKAAAEKIEKAGGKAVTLAAPAPRAKPAPTKTPKAQKKS